LTAWDNRGVLCFEVEVTSNQLWHSYYSPYQPFLPNKIRQLKKEGLGYRKITNMLNEENIKTPRGKTFFPSNVYSILTALPVVAPMTVIVPPWRAWILQ